MAENEGKTRGSLLASIQSAQMAVGSAITGGASAVVGGADGGSVSLLEDIRSINKKSSDNTKSLLQVMKDMFSFDKEKFNRLRDQKTETQKEFVGPMPAAAGGMGGEGGDGKSMPSLGKLAGLTALAAFMTAINADEILRLPQQLKSIRAMATFAKGVGTIGTLGFGPQILKNIKAAIQATSISFPKLFNMPSTFGDTMKSVKAAIRGPLLGAQMQMTLLGLDIKEKFNAFKLAITENAVLKSIGGSIRGAMANIKATFEPVMNSIRSLFGGAGKEGGALSKLITPLKAIGRVIGKLFLPITLILGIFDGVTGFMKEYEETGSIVDGIRGAVVGIVDGFIGNFVRLITDLIGMALSYLGLENLGAAVVAFGENITASFNKVIGGIVDIVTGLFTLDWERIKGGFGALFSGAGNFFFTVLTTPIDLAVNFIKDIFGFGDPEKPFSLKDFFFGEEGLIPSIWGWFTGLFSMDTLKGLGAKLFDMTRIFKALGAGGVAAVKAILPGGLTPGEAFKESYAASMKASEPVIVEEPLDLKGANKVIMADRVVTTEKTSVLNQSGDINNSAPIVVSMPSTAVSQSTMNNNASIMAPLDTGGKLKRRNSWFGT